LTKSPSPSDHPVFIRRTDDPGFPQPLARIRAPPE
jgi:hypothetical protein